MQHRRTSQAGGTGIADMRTYAIATRGVFTTYCYFAIDENSGHGFLIDCGAHGREVAELIHSRGWIIEEILLTHGHFDHTGGIKELQKELDIPVWIHESGKDYLTDPVVNLSAEYGADVIIEDANYFTDGHVFRLEADPSKSLTAIHIPGHTRDSSMFYDEAGHTAYVGDAIFKGQPGIWSFPTGDKEKLLSSIKTRIMTLPDDTILCSGHSGQTTVDAEKVLYKW